MGEYMSVLLLGAAHFVEARRSGVVLTLQRSVYFPSATHVGIPSAICNFMRVSRSRSQA